MEVELIMNVLEGKLDETGTEFVFGYNIIEG